MSFGSPNRFAAVGLLVTFALVPIVAKGAVAVGGGATIAAAAGDVSRTNAAKEAEAFVQTSIDRGYRILDNKGLSVEERQTQFREFLLSIVDTKRVALFTLGGYARTASERDISVFMAAYDDFVAAMYQGYFNWYTGQGLRVSNSAVRSQDDVVVYADIVGPNGARQYKVGFRVRRNEARQNIVTDLQFEGVWLALNQRADFTTFLQQHGGDFAALSAELMKRTQRFKEAWAHPPRS